jgi:hypothetical protein
MAVDPAVLQSFIQSKGLSCKTNSVSFLFTCPRCDKRDKLYIRRRDGRFICFHCSADGFQGRAEYALVELCNMPMRDVLEALYGANARYSEGEDALDLGDLDFGQWGTDEMISERDLPIPTVEWGFGYYPINDWRCKRGAAYLEGRGVSGEIAQQYGLHYSPTERRVGLPITVRGQLVGWQKRLVIPNRNWSEERGMWLETPKILSSKNIPRNRTLMFQERLKGSKHAILCEGPFDALAAHLCGGNVATMGKIVSQDQIDLLTKAGVERVYLALDPDAATEATKVLSQLGGIECYLLTPPPPFKDLGEMGMVEVYNLFLAAPLLSPGHVFLHIDLSRI